MSIRASMQREFSGCPGGAETDPDRLPARIYAQSWSENTEMGSHKVGGSRVPLTSPIHK